MARVKRPDGSKVSGKMSKKSNAVSRIRNGKEHQYEMNPYQGPASRAQKESRMLHGQISVLLNPMMADPAQVRELDRQMVAVNRTLPPEKRFKTTRQFGYSCIKQQLLAQAQAKPRKLTAESPLPRGLKLYIKPFAELSAVELYEILKSRFAVFVLEQGIRYLDEDNIDLTATHLALHHKGQVIAYARLFEDMSDNTPLYDEIGRPVLQPRVLRAGRMLTTEHGKGYGRILITHLIAEAKNQGADILRIHAQFAAVPFYRHFRFAKVGEPFTEAGIQHVIMERKLTKSATK